MKELTNIRRLRGEIEIPGDKSISHRCIMFGSLAEGTTEIHHFLQGADCRATIGCFRQMGIEIDVNGSFVTVHGRGLYGLSSPSGPLDVGNSGTTTRLLSGILAGQSFASCLSGDDSLNSRPMGRIIQPLTAMGANITSLHDNGCAPLLITPGRLTGIHYDSPVASAQVKSCLVLAGLYAEGETCVTEPSLSRNHTELMLKEFGADIESVQSIDNRPAAIIRPGSRLYGQQITVPGDISSAAYFIAAGLLVPDSEILIKNIGINPTRAGILQVCRDMGGEITLLNERTEGGEPIADLLVRTSALHATTIEGSLIPTLIDEIPVIAVMAAMADGTTIIRDAAELKVKETNRIATITDNLKAMGCDVIPTEDGMIVNGGKGLHGAAISPLMDHRIAMAFSIAALVSDGTTTIMDSHCVDVSYPAFYETLQTLY